jgi:hypothetical protein
VVDSLKALNAVDGCIGRSDPESEGSEEKCIGLYTQYSRQNLKLAWERVRANREASGTDGITIGAFEVNLDANLESDAPP